MRWQRIQRRETLRKVNIQKSKGDYQNDNPHSVEEKEKARISKRKGDSGFLTG